MRAAIYARRSNEQHVAEEFKSVTRQVENARAFAAMKGWTVADEHVFIDDGISGSEPKKMLAFKRMMGMLEPKAPFQVLVVSEGKSILREQFEKNYDIKQLALAGVEVYEYVHGRCLTPKNAREKFMASVEGYADEDHREKTAERMHEAHERLAKAGHVTGSRLFGYRNRPVFAGEDASGNPLRSHVERVLDPTEAAVVLHIFRLYDSGLGLRRVAAQLASEQAPMPRPFHRKPQDGGGLPLPGWAPSTVRAILARDIYHGVIVRNKWRKRDVWGQVNPTPRPEEAWVRTPVEDLRIVPEDLWNRVQARRRATERRALRFGDGRLSGRPPRDAAQGLLSGLASCGVCGGGFGVETSSGKKGQRYPSYVCRQHRYNKTCTNDLRVPAKDLEEAVLQAVEEHALTPEAVEQVIKLTERDDLREQQRRLDRELLDNDKRIKRLRDAIEAGGEAPSLVDRIRQLEERQRKIWTEAADLRPVPRLHPAVAENRLAEWRRLLRQSATQGRAVLQRVLRGRLTFWPRGKGYEIIGPLTEGRRQFGFGRGYDFVGPTRFGGLFTGIVAPRPAFIKDDVRGTEHIGPEDTFEGDYGRLLENAERRLNAADNEWRPWRDSNPR